MRLRRHRWPRMHFIWFLLIYLLVVTAGAVTLWLLIPDDVKKAIYETYVNPP